MENSPIKRRQASRVRLGETWAQDGDSVTEDRGGKEVTLARKELEMRPVPGHRTRRRQHFVV